jgi:hypothetical protein
MYACKKKKTPWLTPRHLVDRCQTQVQKKLGVPAQEHTLESFRASQSSIEHSLHKLGHRIDILQMVFLLFISYLLWQIRSVISHL